MASNLARQDRLSEISVRRLTVEDVYEIWRIEESVSVDPWPLPLLAPELLKSTALSLGAFEGEQIVAFTLSQLVTDELHILNVGVAGSKQRQGIGGQLLLELLSDARSQGARSSYLEVRKSNLAAQGLYKKLGFYQVGERARYYRKGEEDALLFQIKL